MPKAKSIAEPAVLARVRLRLLQPGERARFDRLLEERHYLESSRLGGRSLRYVAELDGERVALIAFSAPALHLKSRENWIGWTNSQRWQLQRIGLSPEEAGLCGCWQMIALKRERQILRRGEVVAQPSELSYYVSSLSVAEKTARQMAAHIREHWAACESSSHHRLDRTPGEDASLIAGRQAARAMATLRNLTLGLFELHTRAGQADAAHLPSWRRKMTPSRALELLTRGI